MLWREREVSRDGVRLAVFEAGEPGRPTVLAVHGWPDTHRLWDNVAPALAEHFHVVSYDTRGYGASSRPEPTSAYRLTELARDLFAVADAVSPDAPVHILAHDWGSVQAWEAVTSAGGRIASFLSVSGPDLHQLGEWTRATLSRPTPRNLAAALSQAGSSAYTAFFQTPVLPEAFFARAGSARNWRLLQRVVEGTPAERVTLSPTLREDMVSGLAYYKANIGPSLRHPRPRPTDVPTLLLVNRRDIALRPAIYANVGAHASELWRIDASTGHWLPFAQPDYLARLTIDWVHGVIAGEQPPYIARGRVDGERREFSGRLAVVTGGGSGIGRATAYALAACGAEVIVADLDLAGAEETVGGIAGPAHAYRLDVSDTDAFAEFAETVRRTHGVPDIVVNNAGIGLAGGALDATDAQVDRLLDVNLRGVVTGSRLFGRQLVERGIGGTIVNISSAAAFTPQRSLGVYAASKAGVLLFTESLRAELAGHHIGVSAICPGVVDTPIVAATEYAGVVDADAARDKMSATYRKRGYGPEKVAAAIVTAIRRDRAVVPVTPEAAIGYRTYRFAPWLSRALARVDVLR